MWQGFFAPDAELFFLDIDPECQKHAKGNAKIIIGDQSDPVFMLGVVQEYGPFDVIIDDGGHTMRQQTVSFEVLWPSLKSPGIYLVEDTHTSYMHRFDGGYLKPDSFIEYSKALVDTMHAWYSREPERLAPTPKTRELTSVAFYDSIVVFEKQIHEPPVYKISAFGEVVDAGLQVAFK